MSELGAFQNRFARALLQKPLAAEQATVASLGAGLTVHRNTFMKGLVDALAANYPTIEQLVGREWFMACAAQYANAYPARSPALVLYGEAFPKFLSDFEPAAGLPYLAEVARIDRMWIEAYTSRDAKPLGAGVLSQLSPEALLEQRMTLHSATRFGWFRHSAVTVWLHHRSAQPASELEINGGDEGILITRPRGSVEYARLDPESFTFLDSLRSQATLGEAAMAALKISARTDIACRLAQFVTAGTFAGPRGDSP